MHTPDGLITGWICIAMILISAIPVALAIKNLQKSKSRITAIATVTAIIFLAQMFNFPIENGTSGHLIGATLALLILGLDGAIIAMASVLVIQTLVFGDGGLLAIGANIFNMGIVSVYASHFVMRSVNANDHIRTFLASWTSVLAGAFTLSLQLALSGTVALSLVLPAMLLTHSMIGFAEGFLTILLASMVANRLRNPTIRTSIGISGISLLVLAAIIPFASGEPDGFEMISINYGFFGAQAPVYSAPVPDYAVPLLASTPYLATVLAAGIGYILSFTLPYSSLQMIRG